MNDTDSLLQFSKQYPVGSVLLREGDTVKGDMFVLLQGSVGAYRNYGEAGEVRLSTYEAGSFFGELDFFLDEAPKATFVALIDCIVLAVSRQNLYSFFAGQPGMTFMIIQGLCRQLAATNENYRMLYERYMTEVAVAGSGSRLAQATGEEAWPLAAAELELPAESKSAPSQELESGLGVVPAAEPASSSTSAPASAPEQKASAGSILFPVGHGSYVLPMDHKKDNLLFERDIVCPVCGHQFKALSLFMSKLRQERTDRDMRTRYKGIEPMHYDVITCPACHYSALMDSFAGASKRQAEQIAAKVGPYSRGLEIKTGFDRDTFTVFAGYYLALLCAPAVAADHQLITAKLWLRLARLYEDCGDEKMKQYANRMALADYTYAYEGLRLSEKQNQQLCFVIGDLYYKQDDLENARTFLHYAKMNKDGSQAVKRQADLYLDEVREEIKRRKDSQE